MSVSQFIQQLAAAPSPPNCENLYHFERPYVIFPFHPHQPGKPQSNRTPTASEIALGRPFLIQLQQLFPQTKLVAVGQKTSTALAKWEMAHTAVRHPAHGGAKQFQRALSMLK